MIAVAWHGLRGLAAAALVAAALLLLPPAALLLRGCPMCWMLGLVERLRALSTQRG